jgi:hypothetical protein
MSGKQKKLASLWGLGGYEIARQGIPSAYHHRSSPYTDNIACLLTIDSIHTSSVKSTIIPSPEKPELLGIRPAEKRGVTKKKFNWDETHALLLPIYKSPTIFSDFIRIQGCD